MPAAVSAAAWLPPERSIWRRLLRPEANGSCPACNRYCPIFCSD